MIGVQYSNNLQAKGVAEVVGGSFGSSVYPSGFPVEAKCKKDGKFTRNEPISVLDTRSPSPSTSTSTLSSSFNNKPQIGNIAVNEPTATTAESGGGGGRKEEFVAELQPGFNGGLELCNGVSEKFSLGLEDWESLLSESAGQDQNILRLISGDVDDSSMSLKQLLQAGVPNEIQGNVGFGALDQNSGFDSLAPIGSTGNVLTSLNTSDLRFTGFGFPLNDVNNGKLGLISNSLDFDQSNEKVGSFSNFLGFYQSNVDDLSSMPPGFTFQQQQFGVSEQKAQVLNPLAVLNQSQVENASNLTLNPKLYGTNLDQESQFEPQAKRHNPGQMNSSLGYQGLELLLRKQQLFPQMHHQQMGLGKQLDFTPVPSILQKQLKVPKQEATGGSNEQMGAQQQQVVYDQLYNAAEFIFAGNFSNAQGILARLNHLISPAVKPFQRSAFYFKEALQFTLQMPTSVTFLPPRVPTPFDGMFKMGAYKVFSEVSPFIQFMNFTANQSLLEAVRDAECIHIIDFDIGFGAQWSSLMQELPKVNRGTPSLKITAFASPSTHHSVEISLMHENLTQFANDLGVKFELEMVNFDSFDLNSASASSFRSSESEAILVNFPIWSISSRLSSLPSLLCFIKNLSPKVLVSLDRGCERTDLPFPHHMLHALKYYEALLNSIDAANLSSDTANNKIEKFLIQPQIEATVLGRFCSLDLMPRWRNLFASAGFLPVPISNFAETQAECLLKRIHIRGFHVEKRQTSLVLCWQHQELLSVSTWRC